MDDDSMRARYRTADEIRMHGAIGNLGQGVAVTTHGVATRLIAWPGTGYQTEAVHVLTLEPGEASDEYGYDLAEEAMLCRQGRGEVWLRGAWVEIAPGDVAYFPERVTHAIRNPESNDATLVVVAQITPPQLDLYEEHGMYNAALGVLNHDSVRKMCTNATPATLSLDDEMAYRETQPEVRAWNLTREDVRTTGALFNIFRGAEFSGIGLPMRLILWPGAGSRTAGFNYAYGADGVEDVIHKHPVSDECLVIWQGRGQFFVGGRWVDVEANDVVLAPCGVAHGHRSNDGPAFFGGFASPPQLDLLIPTEYYDDGRFASPETTRLQIDG